MALYKIISLFLIAFLLKVDALSPESVAQKQQNNLALVDFDKSFVMLKDLYDEAKSTLDSFQSCGIGTHLEIFRLATEKLNDFQGCVNATMEIADYEEFLFHLYYYGKFFGFTVIDIVKDVLSCRHQTGFFNILNCTVSEVQSSGPEFDEILSRAKGLIVEVEEDTYNLIYYIKECLGRKSSEFLSETHSLIKKCQNLKSVY